MRFRIVDIKRRNFLARFGTIYHYKVLVQTDDKRKVWITAWANTENPTIEYLMSDIRRRLTDLRE